MNNADRLRKILNSEKSVTLPGVYDCLSAIAAEKAGFESVFTSGFGISASSYGKPDYGLISSSEMLGVIKNIINSISIPLITDLDTGYGNVLNVVSIVEEVCKLGVGGFILEDQVWPKKCGHMEGKDVIDSDEFVEKIKAARFASGQNNTVIIARTDSLAVHGLDEALKRGHKYINAGADILFIEAPQNKEQLSTIAEEFHGTWLLANMVEGGKTPILTQSELEALGFKIIVYGLTGLFSSTKALTISYNYLKSHNSSSGYEDMVDFEEFEELINLPKYKELENKFSKN